MFFFSDLVSMPILLGDSFVRSMYKRLGRSLCARAAPEPMRGARGRSGTFLAFDNTPLTPPFCKEEEGESVMLPSVGNEHDISWVSC